MHHNFAEGIRSLVVWFVDPALDPLAQGDGIGANYEAALRHAIELGVRLREGTGCVQELFDQLNMVVVDPDYNGWLSGTISPARLPESLDFDERELAQAEEDLTVNYRQDQPSASYDRSAPPAGACTWPETEARIRQHFSPARANVDFYFVVDVSGVNIWAQWDGPPEAGAIASTLINVVQELDCLYPVPDRLVAILVDETGMLLLVGLVEGEVLTSGDLAGVLAAFRIIYPQ